MTDRAGVEAAAAFLRARLPRPPDVAIVLGSGLGDVAQAVSDARTIPYADVPHWPAAGVVGHAGRLVAGDLGGRFVLALSGRVHAYEGRGLEAVTFATRTLARLGVRILVLTNAAGGVNMRFGAGTLMAIDDHLNLMGVNPLVGPNDDTLGPRFPDMTEAYSRRLRAIADDAARSAGVALEHGVYAAVLGPSYETPAEVRALRALGADAVGMSTVPEVLAARHLGLEVFGLSCIANPGAGMAGTPLSAGEVLAAVARAREPVTRLLEAFVARL